MTHTKRSDLNISGYGSVPGGEYNAVKIYGRGKITGDIMCNDFVINGSGEIIGKIDCKQMVVNGSGEMRGDIKADSLKVRGAADFSQTINCESLSISGSAGVMNNIDAQHVKISGSCKVKGDLNAEFFSSTGRFEITGLLNAENVDIHLDWSTSRAREIGGENITVMCGKNGFNVLSIVTLGTHSPKLESDVIEGEKVILENTYARVVRGTNVTIGDGCHIELVEYKGTLHKSASARVGEERKI